VLADATQVHQVILNLCTNAWHALPETGGRIIVGLARRTLTAGEAEKLLPLAAGEYVVLSVEDNGRGMDPATQERIFEPFFTTKDSGKGTGLGLAVVHSIVAAHGGAISVHSQPGAGSVFEVFLPALPDTEQAVPAPIPSVARGKGEHILVVDDEPASGTVISLVIERLGYETTYNDNPAAALELLAKGQYAMLVTDLAMPGMTGDVLARQVLARRPDLPILLLSGFIAPGKQESLRAIGIREVLGKPPSYDELAAALHRCLRG
jgi:CheY-like chemotaxis protein